MKGLLVDSNVILDIFLDDPKWVDWSVSVLADASCNLRFFKTIQQLYFREKGLKAYI
jgi:hypothetical protein